MAELDSGAEIRVPRLVGFVIKYLSPVYLVAVFLFWVYTQATLPEGQNILLRTFRDPVALMSVGFLMLVMVMFLLIIAQAVKRWNAMPQPVVEEVLP